MWQATVSAGVRNVKQFFAWSAFCMALLLALPAWAQRGQAYVVQTEPAPTPLTGVPGLFDTNTVPRGGVSASLPSSAVDVGVTENLSVGTYVLAVLPNFQGGPSFALKARYRWYADERFVSVLDATGGYLSLDGADQLSLWGVMVGNNTSLRLGRRHLLTLSLMAARADVTERDSDVNESAALSGLLVGLTYQAELLSWLAVQTTVLNVPLLRIQSDQRGGRVEAETALSRETLFRSLGRLLLVARAGSWVFEAGALVSLRTAGPWASVSKVW